MLVVLCKPRFTSHITGESPLLSIFAILANDNWENEGYNDGKHTSH
jgi:hypothetical protein